MKQPDIQAPFNQVGYLPPDQTPQAELRGLIRSEIARWGKVSRRRD